MRRAPRERSRTRAAHDPFGCEQICSDDDGPPMKGANYQPAETICVPRPIRQPRRLLRGGPGERKTGGSTLPTPATSPSRTRGRPPSTSWACPPATATPKAVISPAINKTMLARGDPTHRHRRGPVEHPALHPAGHPAGLAHGPPDPAGQTQQITRQAVAQLSEL